MATRQRAELEVLKPTNTTRTGVDVGDLIGGTRQLEIECGRGSFNVVYDPMLVTTRLIDRDSEDPDEMAAALCRVISSWDLARDGLPIPVGPGHEAEVAKRVPTGIMSAAFGALYTDQSINPRKRTR